MNIWLQSLLGVIELAIIIVLLLGFHERGWKRGYLAGDKAGYERGRIDTDNWWLSIEDEVVKDLERKSREGSEKAKGWKGWWV